MFNPVHAATIIPIIEIPFEMMDELIPLSKDSVFKAIIMDGAWSVNSTTIAIMV